MLVFAYDGSLNGDWVAHYAVRFAANTSARALRLIHVREGLPASHLQARIGRIADECKVLGVDLQVDLVARGRGDVAVRLLERAPQGATVVSGTRARPRHSALLAGTVSARLLASGRLPVIAIRVVHPGVLGQPGSVLLPLTATSGAAANALPLLRLVGRDLYHLHLLFVCEVSRLRFPVLRGRDAERLLATGRTRVAQIEATLCAGLAPHSFELDSSVVVSNDLSQEIVLGAAKHRSRLIVLDASRRTLRRGLVYGDPLERVLRDTPADVAIHRDVD